MSDRFLKFWRARLRCWHPHHLHLCQKVNITVLVFSITTIRSLFAFLVTQWHTCRNVHMHARIAKLLQRLSERFHFSAISETRDWWISTLVSCILVIVQFKYLCIYSMIGTTKLTHIIFLTHILALCFSYLESQGDVIIVEVQDNNRVVIGRAKIQVSSITDTQVCYTNSTRHLCKGFMIILKSHCNHFYLHMFGK